MASPCLSAPIPPVPTLPDIFVGLQVPPIVISGDFCCSFSISDEPATAIANAALNAALTGLGGEAKAVIGAVNAEILAAALPILRALKALKVSCPLE